MSNLSIQPMGNGENLPIPPIENASDLIKAFRNCKNAGDQVELFFSVAGAKPDVAFRAFVTILQNQASPPMRALALQGLGYITHAPTKQDIASGRSQYSLELLKLIAEEVRGSRQPSTDLTRWSAAWAIEAIGFSPDIIEHFMGGALAEPPYRIRREIVDQNLDRMQRIERFNGRGEPTADYERYLEFWVYGGETTQELLRDNSSSRNYIAVVNDVLKFLHIRGVELGVDSSNFEIQQAAFSLADNIFSESISTEKKLYERLQYFLKGDRWNHEENLQELRRLAAKPISRASNWLDRVEVAQAVVICEKWGQAIRIGEPSIPALEKVINKDVILGSLRHQEENIEFQVKAVETMTKIQFTNLVDRLKVFSKILLCSEEIVRRKAALFLDRYSSDLENIESDGKNVMRAILFLDEYQLKDKPDLSEIRAQEIVNQISDLQKYKVSVAQIFSVAIQSAQVLGNKYKISSTSVKNCLKQQTEDFYVDIDRWIEQLDQQIRQIQIRQRRISENYTLLKNTLDRIEKIHKSTHTMILQDFKSFYKNFDNFVSWLVNTNAQSFNQCKDIESDLNVGKEKVMKQIRGANNSLDQRVYLYSCIFLICISIVFTSGIWSIIFNGPSMFYYFRANIGKFFILAICQVASLIGICFLIARMAIPGRLQIIAEKLSREWEEG